MWFRRAAPAPYPDYMDWTDFRIANAYAQMQWRADTIRRADPDHPITAHGMYDSTLDRLSDRAVDHWRSAAVVDIFGFTGLSANEDRIGKNMLRWGSVDMTRAGLKRQAVLGRRDLRRTRLGTARRRARERPHPRTARHTAGADDHDGGRRHRYLHAALASSARWSALRLLRLLRHGRLAHAQLRDGVAHRPLGHLRRDPTAVAFATRARRPGHSGAAPNRRSTPC